VHTDQEHSNQGTWRKGGGQRMHTYFTGGSASWEGVLSQSIPRLCPIYSPLHWPHQSYLTNPSPGLPDLISSNHTQLDPLGLTPSPSNNCQKPSQNSCPQPQGCSSLARSTWVSHDDHTMTHHPCHLVSWSLKLVDLGPEGPNPLSFHLFLSNGILMLLNCSAVVHMCPWS